MLVYFEGVDGVGKSSVMRALSEALTELGVEHILTKEPGGPKALLDEWEDPDYPYGPMYDNFRELCVNNPQIPQMAERALYRADSICNWELVIEPNLHKVVLCDRSWVSDIAYGAVLTSASMRQLYEFNRALTPEQVLMGHVVYVSCDEAVREQRLNYNITNHMDKIGVEKRRLIERAYGQVLDLYVPSRRQMRLDSTKNNPEQLADIIISGLFRKEA